MKKLSIPRPVMTNDMMILQALLSKYSDGSHGERRPERLTHRNVFRNRSWETRVGTIELRIPKVRKVHRRGLNGVRLVVSDAHEGLKAAVLGDSEVPMGNLLPAGHSCATDLRSACASRIDTAGKAVGGADRLR